MSPRAATRLAWGLWAVCVALLGTALALEVYAHLTSTPAPDSESLTVTVVFFMAFATFPTVGALIASHQPKNLVGWVICGAGAFWSVNILAETYAETASERIGPLPGEAWMAWLADWTWLPPLGLALVFLPLLFPDGRLAAPRWRIVAWLAVLAIALWGAGEAFRPGRLTHFENPVGLHGAGGVLELSRNIGAPLLVACVAGSALSVILRLIRARGAERQQLKWFVFAVAIIAPAFALSGTPVDLLASIGWYTSLFTLSFGVPIAIGVAIFRYRLYDIDRIINRTLVYGLLTAGLAATYFGLVVGLQALFRPLTGGSGLAITATTLVVAAAFQPARRRIQDTVDSRFNRRRYDAAQTLAAFSARLRDIVDLDTLQRELLVVVEETVEPTHVSLWLRPMETRR